MSQRMKPANPQNCLSYDTPSGRLYLLLARDTTGDGLFTDADEARVYTHDPTPCSIAREIVDDQTRERLHQLVK
jgi:hypothetical protein